MNDNIEELKFKAAVIQTAMKRLGGSFPSGEGTKILDELYRDFLNEGKPNGMREWIFKRIEPLFRCVSDRPRWVGLEPEWPWSNDVPMVFIQQYDVPDYELADGRMASKGTIFIFSGSVPSPFKDIDGWMMKYEVVWQTQNL